MSDELKTDIPPVPSPAAGDKKEVGWFEIGGASLVAALLSGIVTYHLAVNHVQSAVQADLETIKAALAAAPRVMVFDTIAQTKAMPVEESSPEFKRISEDLRSRQDELLSQGIVVLDRRAVINAPDGAVLPILK